VEHRPLGASGLEVSALALGSWKTYELIPRERGVAVMQAARQAGIDFLDDARYDDTTGEAPLRTGYSEVVFGEFFREAGWKRDDVVVANKLWWEFWPEQSAAAELDASLGRMGLDDVDLIYAERPPERLGLEQLVTSVAALLEAGKARAWGVLNWRPELILEVAAVARIAGVPPPSAVQLVYNVAHPQAVESPALEEALDACGASVVASAVLAGGALTGKYARGAGGRLAAERDVPQRGHAFAVGVRLAGLAERLETTPARLAIAFALAQPRVASVLFGATSPEQVEDDVGALELLERLTQDDLVELRELGSRNA